MSQPGGHIRPTWVLLDNNSTVEKISNRRLLKNIRKSNREMAIFSMGDQTTTDLKGGIPGHWTVWFHPGGIINIPSLSQRWRRNTVWLTTALVKINSWYIYQGERSDTSISAIGGCSTPTWPRYRGRYS